MTIWKYPLPQKEQFALRMPKRANLLTVQLQDGVPTLWAMVDPSEDYTERDFVIVGTGHCIDVPRREYIGTWQMGSYVWHLFDAGEKM